MRWIVFLVCIICSPAFAGFHGGGIVNAWNGNLVQSQLGDQPAYPFIDYAKSPTGSELENSGQPDERKENIEGYPSTFLNTGATSCESAGTDVWSYGNQIPTAFRTGTIQLQWTGCAYININNGATITGIGQNTCSGSCQACVEVDSTDAYGTNCWIQFSSSAVTNNQADYKIKSVGDGSTDPQLTDVNEFYYSDLSAMNTCNAGRATGNITELESCFTPQLISIFKEVGVIRFINVMGGNNVITAQSTFEENTPLYYYKWKGNNHQLQPSELSPNEITNNSGNEYNLNFTGLTISDRTNFQAIPAANIVAPSFVTSGSTAACTSSCVIQLSSVTGIVSGMLVGDGTTGSVLSDTAYVISVDSGLDQVTISCTNWVSAPTSCKTVNGAGIANGDTLYFSPMLEINSSGTYYPLGSNSGGVINLSSLATIHGGVTAAFTYIASLNRFAVETSTNNSGLFTGWPLEIMTALANATGAHPYFNAPPFSMGTTDWLQKTAAYEAAHLSPGLIPFFEGTDEIWNTGYDAYYFSSFEQNYYSGGNQNSLGLDNQWYGWRMSQMGQTLSTQFGNPTAANRFKYYRLIDALAAQAGGGTPNAGEAFTGTVQDAKLSFTGNGNDPAYKWVTDIAFASYYSPWMGSTTSSIATAQSLAAAYAYNLSPSETYIHSYLDGVNTVASGSDTLYAMHNTVFPGFSAYVGAYVNDSTHGGPYNIRLTQYEGGEYPNPLGYTTSNITIAVTATSTGSTTTFTTADNAFDYLCNPATYNLCPGSGSPTVTLSGFSASNCTFNTLDKVVTAGTSTSITIAYDSSSGNSGCGTGTITYDNSATYWPAFVIAAGNDAALTACELASMDDFYAQALAITPTPVAPEFPSIYNWTDQASFGVARYFGSPFASPGATIPAVASFQLSQSGPTSCSP